MFPHSELIFADASTNCVCLRTHERHTLWRWRWSHSFGASWVRRSSASALTHVIYVRAFMCARVCGLGCTMQLCERTAPHVRTLPAARIGIGTLFDCKDQDVGAVDHRHAYLRTDIITAGFRCVQEASSCKQIYIGSRCVLWLNAFWMFERSCVRENLQNVLESDKGGSRFASFCLLLICE